MKKMFFLLALLLAAFTVTAQTQSYRVERVKDTFYLVEQERSQFFDGVIRVTETWRPYPTKRAIKGHLQSLEAQQDTILLEIDRLKAARDSVKVKIKEIRDELDRNKPAPVTERDAAPPPTPTPVQPPPAAKKSRAKSKN